MKRNLALALTGTLLFLPRLHAADLPAPLPEFMDKAQLTQWTTAQMAKTIAVADSVPTPFYTGKPYLAEAGGYIYKYRTYNPESAHWTSADPSGFPDGTNNQNYLTSPNTQVDANGLFGVTVTGSATYNYSTPNGYNGGTVKETSSDIATLSSMPSWLSGAVRSEYPTLTLNTLSTSPSLIVNVSSYAAGAHGIANISANVASSTYTPTQYRWIQGITTNDPLNGATSPYIDPYPNDDNLPFYETNAEIANGSRPVGTFNDGPSRPFSDLASHNPITWRASTFLVDYNASASTITVLGGFSYGFDLRE